MDFAVPLYIQDVLGKVRKMDDFYMYYKKVLETHHLVNKDAEKTIPVSSAPILDWGPLLIALGLFQSGICARKRKPQPEVMQGSWSVPERLQISSSLFFQTSHSLADSHVGNTVLGNTKRTFLLRLKPQQTPEFQCPWIWRNNFHHWIWTAQLRPCSCFCSWEGAFFYLHPYF